MANILARRSDTSSAPVGTDTNGLTSVQVFESSRLSRRDNDLPLLDHINAESKRPIRSETSPSRSDGNSRDARPPLKKTKQTVEERNLACPFYKRDRIAHRRCGRLTLTKISYVKQHLMRKHSAPIHCGRCYEIFLNDEEFDHHQRKIPSCEIQPRRPIIGVTESQRRQLIRRSNQSLAPDEQWLEIWKILFPDDVERLHPSPYVDLDRSEDFNWFRDYLFTKMPDIVQEQISGRLSRHALDDSDSDWQGMINNVLENIIADWEKEWTGRGENRAGQKSGEQ